MVRINWLAVKTFSVFIGGFLFLMGALNVVSVWKFGGDLEVGRENTQVYGPEAQLWIGIGLLVVGGLMAGIPLFQGFAEVVRVGRRRLAHKEEGEP